MPPILWRCDQAPLCPAVLGFVHGGALYPLAGAVRVEPGGIVEVTCPLCQSVREWRPNPLRAA